MKKNLLIIIFIMPLFVHAQFTDNFSDGNFTANPAWLGDGSQFTVNGALQLQLNNVGAGQSYLSAGNNLSSLDTTEWRFWIHLNFSPSGQNYGRVYLVSDQSNLENSLNGYYLQFGENLANDAIELFRQTGTTSTSVCRGTNAQIAAPFTVGVKVTRNTSGLWSLYVDASGSTNYIFENSGTDLTYTSSSFFGIVCTYTTTNATNFFFDDFFVGPIVADITPPMIVSSIPTGSTQLDVKFSEAVDLATSQTISNYSVNNGIGNPVSAARDVSDISLVHLTFATSFPGSVTDTIRINNVSDLAGNSIIANSNATFIYVQPSTPSPFDVVINEFMADPSPPVALPDAEFVELFNRSSNTFNLTGWVFSDASTTVSFGNQTLLPGSYLILCSSSFQSAFSVYGSTAGFSSFPSLNNTGGETLTLKDNSGAIIDQVFYDETFYHNLQKANGGWTIERIDPDFTCSNSSNWKASEDASGGTPGSINSVHAAFADNTPPEVTHVCVLDSNHVKIYLSELISDTALSNTLNYVFNTDPPNQYTPLSAVPAPDQLSVVLGTPYNIALVNLSQVHVNSSMTDCAGNAFQNNSTPFQFPQHVDSGNIIINEVLFHYGTGGKEFVELYNRSEKAFDLKDVQITRRDLTSRLLDPSVVLTSDCFLMLPGDYVVLSDDPEIVKSNYYTPNPKAFLKMNLPSLTDAEDDIVLLDNAGNILDELHYYESWQLPLLNNLAGVSLERLNPGRQTQDQTNWHSAAETVGFATPGYKNSEYNDSQGNGSEVSVDPEIFSPDNDGHNDVVNVHYHFDHPGNVANVTVYDAKGRLIRTLINNELIGNDGSFVWDGITNQNDKARIGMYIFYIEVFDIQGDTKNYKKTCVLASKL